MTSLIYLDNQATTACDPRVLEAMWPWFTTRPGNPGSVDHAAGQQAADAVEAARADIAALIGATPAEIIFTSGATEANNLAIKGAARFAGPALSAKTGGRTRIVTAATEHKCVLESVRDLAAEGFDPVILPVTPSGAVDREHLADALQTPTLLVSLMAANNEIGIIYELDQLGAVVRAAGARFHSDLAQAAGKIPIDVNAQKLDLASLSAHKMHGPKGIGALYVRRHPRMRLAPLFSGGGQERGLRSGTLPTPLIVGFGAACRIARTEQEAEQTRIAALRDRLLAGLRARIPALTLNGAPAPRLAGNLSLRFPGVRALDLIAACPTLAISTGAACSSADIAPSHVLTALGLSPAEAAASLRLGIGRFNSPADIDTAITRIADAYAALAPARPVSAEA
jgi:cysteine desulfurase